MSKYQPIVDFIRSEFPNKEFIPLHEPRFSGNEKKYVLDAIDSTFVSSIGAYVDRFEEMMATAAGTKYAIATVNGTSALHTSLILANVKAGDEIITQALTFVATVNAISYCGALPIFVDVDRDTMGLSPDSLRNFLTQNCDRTELGVINKKSGKRIRACIPMHTFGLPLRIAEIKDICSNWGIALIEDAAESIGSLYDGRSTGSFGLMGVFSFNGNKILTCGGGGAIVTDDENLAKLAKHLTTQSKIPHRWEFNHDMIGYNYRMPNLNAAMACAQLELLEGFVDNKRNLAMEYQLFFKNTDLAFKSELTNCESNYWLNAIELPSLRERNEFLEFTNDNGVMTRPIWNLMSDLSIYSSCESDGLVNSKYLRDRIVNIPSSVRI